MFLARLTDDGSTSYGEYDLLPFSILNRNGRISDLNHHCTTIRFAFSSSLLLQFHYLDLTLFSFDASIASPSTTVFFNPRCSSRTSSPIEVKQNENRYDEEDAVEDC
ncbi:unnamed protein product [Vicia faba]|uniref:Uncharacterized protein n=1 Tax=Vicia faba TaxID=3906 RepID=A0AAV0YCR8_VICFA|nr:unnamed protein product [Vicia faba]